MNRLYLLLKVIVIFYFTVARMPLEAQQAAEVNESLILSQYFDEIYGADERLVSGPFYFGAMRGPIQGHPYWFDEEWKIGSVELGETRFDNLLLKYDILINQVILKFITSNNAAYQVGLRSGNITRLTIGTHTFIPFPHIRDSANILFAELLSEGEVQYMLTRNKYLVLTNGSGMADYTYKENVKQYLYSGDQPVPFRGKSALLKLYPGLKSELKQYARKNRLQLGPKKHQDRAKWVDHCNVLLKTSQ